MRLAILLLLTLLVPSLCLAQDEESEHQHSFEQEAPQELMQDDIGPQIQDSGSEPFHNFEQENQEAPKEEDKSIFDILFGSKSKDDSAANSELEYHIDGTLSPGEVEVNITNSEGDFANTAQLNLIDKTIGKLYKINVPVSNRYQLNEIVINVLSCWNPSKVNLLSLIHI